MHRTQPPLRPFSSWALVKHQHPLPYHRRTITLQRDRSGKQRLYYLHSSQLRLHTAASAPAGAEASLPPSKPSSPPTGLRSPAHELLDGSPSASLNYEVLAQEDRVGSPLGHAYWVRYAVCFGWDVTVPVESVQQGECLGLGFAVLFGFEGGG